MLRWGVVGIGNIVTQTVAPAMVAETNCELVAGVSRDIARARSFANDFGAAYAYDDYRAMLANDEVDAVYIATPNAQHPEQVVLAAQAGKHVFCDKPLGTSLEGALRAVEACRDAGVTLGVNFHNRALAWVNDARDIIAGGRIGDVLTVEVHVGAGHRPPQSWRADRELAGLGTTYNVGVHAFDFLRYMLGADPVEVTALFDNENGAYDVETQALVLLRFDNGAYASVNANQRIPAPTNHINIFGTDGRLTGRGLTRSRKDGELTLRTKEEESTVAYQQPSGEAHRHSLAAYTAAVLDDRQPPATGADGLHSMLLCDAIARAVAERRLVDVDYATAGDLLS